MLPVKILKDIELFPPEEKLHLKIMRKIKPGKTKKKGSSSSSINNLGSVD